MCLVSEALKKLETVRRVRQNNWLFLPGNKNFFVLLG